MYNSLCKEGCPLKKKVVVIDDKPLIRQSIVQTIDWDKLHCEVVGQAEDGIEGKRVILEQQPDILITDIKMPGLSGLDLAEHLKEIRPASKTILITGYQDFEYAQRAIRIGVMDFIVKPIRNAELQVAISSAVKELDDRLLQADQMKEKSEAYSNKLIMDLLGGYMPESMDVNRVQQELGLQFKSFIVLIISTGPRGFTGESDFNLSREYARLFETVHRVKKQADFDIVGCSHHNQLVLVCLFSRPLWQSEVRMKLQPFCQDLVLELQRDNGLSCRITVSSARKSLKELSEAYAEAASLIEAGFFRSEEPLLYFDQIPSSAAPGKLSIIRDLERFDQLFEQSSIEQMIEQLEQLLEKIAVYSEGNILVAKGLLSESCLALARFYYRVTGDEFGLDKSIDQILCDIYQLGSMRGASQYLEAFIKSIKLKLEGGNKEYSLMVKEVIDYINSNFADNISLTAVAEHFGLSPSYLSRLLRAETGINFVDLVYKARIEAAKRLLRNPKYKVNEVGEMVGYKDYAYFYQVFKKLEGISPKSYKNQCKGSPVKLNML
ncbi:Two-component response regulator, YesN/AraC family, consists of REC and AraC-type DNA-binding domains [Paenibacillus sp. UNCCL117]|nr:Two-component response regulator, YesN/AraC family, consists of REC and AraC-type DNA-binding domains [Paenibacillus sp. cl123]SFW11359.1 Two-component response regulator, YesN/AraC family, consists of REC and AraC-type DNA-binding domains [Paenibacillus sp. UNCCL117]